MVYSYRIEQAIRAAAILHQGQSRKGPAPYPYITHLFSVACIVADYTENEDAIVTGLLHDVLEETEYTAEELEVDFGPTIRTYVESLTEYHDADDDRPWLLQRKVYLDSIERAGAIPQIVSAADKIHNMRSIVEEYQDNLAAYLTDFGGTLEDRLVFYQKLSNILNRELKNPIVGEFNHVFDEYKKFVNQHA